MMAGLYPAMGSGSSARSLPQGGGAPTMVRMLTNRDVEHIESWSGDFAGSFAASSALEGAALENAGEIAKEFLLAACHRDQVTPDEITPEGVRDALLDKVTELALPQQARERAPEVVALFLEWLEDGGRLAGGREFAQSVRAMAPGYLDRLAPDGGVKRPALKRAAEKVGRNDPCPCGSGKKYKKCCGA